MKNLTLLLFTLFISFAAFGQAPAPVSGPTEVCIGVATPFTDTSAGGTWSVSAVTIATINAATGLLTGLTPGPVTITYTTAGGIATYPITVNPTPAGITGPAALCIGSAITLSDGIPGGVWSSSDPVVAGVSAIGVVTGVSAGTAIISYTTGSCTMTTTVTVNTAPAPITGATTVCAGATITLADPAGGGTWSSSSPSAASVGISGIVTGGGAGGSAVISYTLPGGCAVSVTVTINPSPAVFTLSTGGSYCAGGTGVDITLSGSSPGFPPSVTISYRLFNGSLLMGSMVVGTGLPIDFGRYPAGIYTATATYSSTGCTVAMANSDTITALPLPTRFTVTGGGTYCLGGSGADVGLSGSTTGLTYQLYDGSIAIASVPGTGSPIDFGLRTAAGVYTVTAINTLTGCTDTMTGAAVVSIAPIPVISGPTAVCAGGTITETAPGFPGGDWGSSNAAVATVSALTGIISGIVPGTTTITLTSPAGCTGTTIVTVNLSPAPITGTASICLDSATTLHDASPGGIWTSASTAIATVSLTTGAVTGITAGTAVISYSLGSGGCSVNKIVTVNALPTVYTLGGGGSYCSGGAGRGLILSGSDGGTTYQLLNSGSAIGAAVAGTGSPLDFGSYTFPGTYTAVATNSSGCMAFMSDADTIFITPLPAIYNVTGGGGYCAGGTGVHIDLSASDAGVTYQLYNAGAAAGAPVAGTGSTLDFGPHTAAGIYNIVATNAAGCTSGMAGSDTITINPLPTAYTVTGGGSYCTGGAGSPIGLGSSDFGVSYQLFMGGAPVGAPVAGTGMAIDFGLHTDTGTYAIVAVNTATSCAANMSGSARVTVSPFPAVFTVIGGGPYCTGGAGVAIGLSGSGAGVTYQLYSGIAAVGSAVAGSGSAISFGLQTVTGVYTVVASNASGCTDTMAGSTTVSISTLPAVHNVTGGGAYCSGGTGFHVGLDGSNTGINYQLYGGGLPAGSPVAGTASALDFGVETSAGVYTVVAINAATGCSSNMTGSATITVIPSATPSVSIAAAPGDTVCLGTVVTYTATPVDGGLAPAYSWRVNGIAVSAGSTYTYTPANGDVVNVMLTSSASCVSPATVSSPATTMHASPLPAISGGSAVCSGSYITLADTSGGIWTSSDPAIATIATIGGATGVVSGVAPGTATLTYTLAAGCSVTTTFTVRSLPVITAAASAVSCGGAYTLTASGGVSYSWSPSTGVSCTACAVTDVIPDATTTYIVTGTDPDGCTSTASVSVDGNRISGYISPAPAGPLKVWLIQFNPSDSSLTALDSATTCTAGGLPYYEFDDKPAGSYMVKAYDPAGIPGASGYIPTYGISSSVWNTATGITHTAAADTMHISMIYGAVPPGPGFIGGLIVSGAGRGTTTDIPAAGMLVYLKDAVSGEILTYTYTNSLGRYAFSGLANGAYIVYPELYQYYTTPAYAIMLTTASDSANAVDFKQHDNYGTITPFNVTTGVKSLTTENGLTVYPNPASGSLNIQWNNQPPGSADVVITDVAGRDVYKAAVNISTAAGRAQISLDGLKSGIYLITIKSANIYYSGKLVIE